MSDTITIPKNLISHLYREAEIAWNNHCQMTAVERALKILAVNESDLRVIRSLFIARYVDERLSAY